MRIMNTKGTPISQLVKRAASQTADVSQVVTEILQNVKTNGDQALHEYNQKFDQVTTRELKVTAEELAAGTAAVPTEFITVLKNAKKNIVRFHEKQRTQGFVMTEETGAVMGQQVKPLATVGVYVPGGTAAYPSTVLMDVLPAKIAGVEKIVMITPPDPAGKIPPAILAAASIAGVDEIYKVGGAHGVAALAYGTETIPKVDKIVGPGNIYVATAKRFVYGEVDIDMIAGPSDVLIVADESARADWLAADLLAQAEHDVLAQAILVTTDEELAQDVATALTDQLADLPRQAIAKTSLDNNGKIIVAQNLAEALVIANEIAPEHLELAVKDPFALLGQVKNAGSIFLGHHTPEVLGDYFAGPNHTLPTEGTARFYSPLSVDDFVKKNSFLYYSSAALQAVSQQVAYFAEVEGLAGHARSMTIRLEAEEE